MNDLWERIEAWGKKAGAGSLKLRDGAPEADIAAAENVFGFPLPADYRASLLLHDGQESEPDFDWLPGCSPLQPLHAIIERWKEERGHEEDFPGSGEDSRDDPRLLDGLFNAKRVPIAGTQWWDGDNVYLDLAPGSKGTAGQIVSFVTECDLAVVDTGLRAALERYATFLETGKLVWNAELGGVVPKSGPWNGNPTQRYARMK